MKAETNRIFEELFERYSSLEECRNDILGLYKCIKDTYEKGGKLMLCGNGGSAADCLHITGELMKGFMLDRRLSSEDLERFAEIGAGNVGEGLQYALPAVSLVCESALMSAYCNDCSPELVFAQQIYGMGNPGDTLLCLSTSGNSENVVNGAYAAMVKGCKVASLVGRNGGKLKDLSNVCVKLPSDRTFEIQENTLPVYHTVCAMLENEFFGE